MCQGASTAHVGLVPNPISERRKHLQPRIHEAHMQCSVWPYCVVHENQLRSAEGRGRGDVSKRKTPSALCKYVLYAGYHEARALFATKRGWFAVHNISSTSGKARQGLDRGCVR